MVKILFFIFWLVSWYTLKKSRKRWKIQIQTQKIQKYSKFIDFWLFFYCLKKNWFENILNLLRNEFKWKKMNRKLNFKSASSDKSVSESQCLHHHIGYLNVINPLWAIRVQLFSAQVYVSSPESTSPSHPSHLVPSSSLDDVDVNAFLSFPFDGFANGRYAGVGFADDPLSFGAFCDDDFAGNAFAGCRFFGVTFNYIKIWKYFTETLKNH